MKGKKKDDGISKGMRKVNYSMFCFVFKIGPSYFKKHSQHREKHKRERLIKLSPRKIRRKQVEDKACKGKEV